MLTRELLSKVQRLEIKTRRLVNEMAREGWIFVLEDLARQQVARQAARPQEIADLLAQLLKAEARKDWNQVKNPKSKVKSKKPL